MNQSNHFFSLGYGWLCKHCSAEDSEKQSVAEKGSSPNELALASWTDASHHTLTCPRCGIEEKIADIS